MRQVYRLGSLDKDTIVTVCRASYSVKDYSNMETEFDL
jgi:hypothetical protein